MRGTTRFLLATISLWATSCTGSADFRQISLGELRDRIEGGWAGQMIGVTYGAPTEFRFLERIIDPMELPEWRPEMVANALDQDDLYVEMTFSQVLDDKGLAATTADFGAMFRDAEYRLWHANLAARRALKRGVPAGESGSPRYNAHANDIDFQIEADFIGLMSPGLPVAANDLCWRAGRVMNTGDGIYGGMFVSGMYTAAFFEDDIRTVVETGLATIPASSPYAQIVTDVLAWSLEHPDDWQIVWRLIEDKWNAREPCPAGALRPFNIDAKLNGAYIALGLLYGERDFDRTLEIATRSGQDSDCNPSNALGILGVMLGYDAIPTRWTSGIAAIADETFSYTNYSFRTIVESTEQRAIAMVEAHGGRLAGDILHVPLQAPVAATLEIWDDYGSPVERIATDDPRCGWSSSWEIGERSSRRPDVGFSFRSSDQAGAETTIQFEGTGAILVGPYLPDGGIADVYLDGELHRKVDSYSDELEAKGGEAVWHAFALVEGTHDLRVVVQGEPFAASQGALVVIDELVVFR